MCVYIYICIYIYMCVYIYIYILSMITTALTELSLGHEDLAQSRLHPGDVRGLRGTTWPR